MAAKIPQRNRNTCSSLRQDNNEKLVKPHILSNFTAIQRSIYGLDQK